jgi:release factor glutamine methyltransferase
LVAGWAIERLARDRRPGQDLSAKRLVELCAGSGAISLAVAVEAKTPRSAAINATVAVEGKIVGSAQDGSTPADGSTGLLQWAVENSPTALAYLRRNLAGTGVAVVAGDMATALPELDGQVDVVVANPPYVPAAAWADLPPDVRGFDPREALVAGPDGLDAIRVVARVAQRLLRPGGAVVCEHDDTQGATAPAVFRAAGFHRVEDHADLAGRPRFSTAWK